MGLAVQIFPREERERNLNSLYLQFIPILPQQVDRDTVRYQERKNHDNPPAKCNPRISAHFRTGRKRMTASMEFKKG